MMPLQDNELQGTLVTRLQRRVDGMQKIALKVQNVLDDVAGALERCNGLICWADPNASTFFLLIATSWALLIAVLGLHTVLSALLCWMVSPHPSLYASLALILCVHVLGFEGQYRADSAALLCYMLSISLCAPSLSRVLHTFCDDDNYYLRLACTAALRSTVPMQLCILAEALACGTV